MYEHSCTNIHGNMGLCTNMIISFDLLDLVCAAFSGQAASTSTSTVHNSNTSTVYNSSTDHVPVPGGNISNADRNTSAAAARIGTTSLGDFDLDLDGFQVDTADVRGDHRPHSTSHSSHPSPFTLSSFRLDDDGEGEGDCDGFGADSHSESNLNTRVGYAPASAANVMLAENQTATVVEQGGTAMCLVSVSVSSFLYVCILIRAVMWLSPISSAQSQKILCCCYEAPKLR